MHALLGSGTSSDTVRLKNFWVTEDRGLHHAVTWHELVLYGHHKKVGVSVKHPFTTRAL